MPIIIDQLDVYSDARGRVFEPLEADSFAAQRNSHVVINMPGAVRGNHYHDTGLETAIVMGPALIRVREDGVARDIEVPPEKVYRFSFPPEVSHAIKNTGKRPNVIVVFYTFDYDPDNPDSISDILIDPEI